MPDYPRGCSLWAVRANIRRYKMAGKKIEVEVAEAYGRTFDLEKLYTNLSQGRLKGYKIERGQVYLYGICAGCLKGEKRKDGRSRSE